jgi:hypothetical protein
MEVPMNAGVLLSANASVLHTSQNLRDSARRFDVGEVLLMVFLLFFTGPFSRAVTPDPKLLTLVPPKAQMVAGLNAPPRSNQPSSILLSTHRNMIDLNDFIALNGVDDSHFIDQVIMVTSEGGQDVFTEHSLLAAGRFDRARMYRVAYGTGAKWIKYRGIVVLEIQPLTRERGSFHDVRWLVIIDSDLALFGTISSIRQELDRYLARSTADPSLVQKLSHLRRDDATWCVATLPDRNSESDIRAIFQILDPRLAEFLRAGNAIQLGIRYGRQVEFEYELDIASGADPETAGRFLDRPSAEANGYSLLSAADMTRLNRGVRGVLKVSKARYENWITEVGSNTSMRAAAAASSR